MAETAELQVVLSRLHLRSQMMSAWAAAKPHLELVLGTNSNSEGDAAMCCWGGLLRHGFILFERDMQLFWAAWDFATLCEQ